MPFGKSLYIKIAQIILDNEWSHNTTSSNDYLFHNPLVENMHHIQTECFQKKLLLLFRNILREVQQEHEGVPIQQVFE